MEKYIRSRDYYIGYERGANDKFSAESFWDAISFNRLLNSTGEDEREREQGYKDGLNTRYSKKWENILRD